MDGISKYCIGGLLRKTYQDRCFLVLLYVIPELDTVISCESTFGTGIHHLKIEKSSITQFPELLDNS